MKFSLIIGNDKSFFELLLSTYQKVERASKNKALFFREGIFSVFVYLGFLITF